MEASKDDNNVECPFTVLIDTAEQSAWTFAGIKADANQKNLPLIVPYRYSCLGRHPHSRGDYTIEGFESHVGIERKGIEDAWGTFLGWSESGSGMNRRERFECELENLSKMNCPIVIVEAELDECLNKMPRWGKKSIAANRKIFFRSVVSWQQKYRIPFWFMNGRRAAEIGAFRYLEKFWQHETKKNNKPE